MAMLTAALVILSAASAAQGVSRKLDVELKKTEPVPLQASEYADVWLEVTNTGGATIDSATLQFRETYPFSVDPGERKSWDLGTLVPGEEYQVHLQVKVDENAVQGKNRLKFYTSTGGDTLIGHEVPVEVRSDNNILSVEKVYMPGTVSPGSGVPVNLTLRNMAGAQLKNIEVALELDKLPFATAGSATRNIEKMEPGALRNASFRLEVDGSAENSVYRLPVTLDYENEAGTSFTQETSTGVVVGGRPELEVGINSERPLTPGQNTLTLRVVNRGYGSADFVQLSVEDGKNYEITTPNEVYLGEMDPDDYQTADFEVFVQKDAEELSIPVELSYRTRDRVTENRTLHPELYTGKELQKYGLGGGKSPVLYIVVLVIVAAASYYYWRKRKKG